MKTNQLKSLLGLAVLVIVAILIDLTYKNVGLLSAQNADFQPVTILFKLRTLVLTIVYTAFFIAGFPLITTDYSSHRPTGIILVVGLVILICITFVPGGQSGFARYLHKQIVDIATSPLRVTIHIGAMLAALGFYRFGRSFFPKKASN